MANNTYPIFKELEVASEDIQAIEDIAELSYNQATSKDGIFSPGIINEPQEYVSLDTNANGENLKSFSIKAFIANSKSGKRMQLTGNLSGLYPSSSVNSTLVSVSPDNSDIEYMNVPVWSKYSADNFNALALQNIDEKTGSLSLAIIKKGAILHGARLKIVQSWINSFPGTFLNCSIGTDDDNELVIPKFNLLNSSISSDVLTTANTLLSFSNENTTQLKIFFESDVNLSEIVNGSMEVHLCLADIYPYSVSETEDPNGIKVDTINNPWPVQSGDALYWLVARHVYSYSMDRNINTDELVTTTYKARKTDSIEFRLLRRAGAGFVDDINIDDVRIAVIETHNGTPIIYSNVVYNDTYNNTQYNATQYFKIPSYRVQNLTELNEQLTNQIEYFKTLSDSQKAQITDIYKILTAMSGQGLLLTGNLGDITESIAPPTVSIWNNTENNTNYNISYVGTRLTCNGQYVPKSMYPDLFNLIGTRFNYNNDGSIDANVPSNMFKMPNYIDVYRKGSNNINLVNQELNEGTIISHTHTYGLSQTSIRQGGGSTVNVTNGVGAFTSGTTSSYGSTKTEPDNKNVFVYIESQKSYTTE